ncbi:MAG: phycoerythrobilin:ferredoxin oxidoreductase, partial [Moorea sp. SIO2B7]|nr:phycoerythrobilin:ferredoxin oxidoreductase [Moorena sp. SIO2B7]
MTLYQPFLDYAIALLEERLDLKPYPIPEGFESKKGITGKGKRQEEVLTTSYAVKSPKLRQIRAAHVQGGKSLQVLNFVIFP